MYKLLRDPAAAVPTVLCAGGVPVSLAAGVGMDVWGARGADPFGVSPRIRPLREKHIGGSVPAQLTGVGVDRAGDYVLGVANYLVTPQEKTLNINDALNEGFKSMVRGGSGSISSSSADTLRPVSMQSGK
ncbi:hypothetical protein [Rothia sp. P5766]|uniref:hypothetical protein n=1 Tax=Rothia sp. P5766 TaxID=3402656 RepID=UPI003AEA738C